LGDLFESFKVPAGEIYVGFACGWHETGRFHASPKGVPILQPFRFPWVGISGTDLPTARRLQFAFHPVQGRGQASRFLPFPESEQFCDRFEGKELNFVGNHNFNVKTH
jgi:hypothetical protein